MTRTEERWRSLMECHGAALRRVVATYERDPGRQEDLFQDVCLALWQALPRFRGESSERTFLFRIAHNRSLSHGHRQGRRRRQEADEEEAPLEATPDPRPSPEDETAATQRRRLLLEAIRRLPVGQRQLLSLALEGLPLREIADIVGISEGNVAVRLHRARAALRSRLQAAS